MKSKLFAIFTLSVLVLNTAASTLTDTKASAVKKAKEGAAIVAMLPASAAIGWRCGLRYQDVSRVGSAADAFG